MTYKVALLESDEGYAVWCPTLPGCASQGKTEEEALANIADAIHDYLEVSEELRLETESDHAVAYREVQVA